VRFCLSYWLLAAQCCSLLCFVLQHTVCLPPRGKEHPGDQPGQNPKYWPLQALISRIWPSFFLCYLITAGLEPGGILTGTFFQKIVLTRCGCAAGCARNEPTGMPLKYAIKNQGCLKLFGNQSGMARSAIPEFEGAC
jgi:hypothetical protein